MARQATKRLAKASESRDGNGAVQNCSLPKEFFECSQIASDASYRSCVKQQEWGRAEREARCGRAHSRRVESIFTTGSRAWPEVFGAVVRRGVASSPKKANNATLRPNKVVGIA